MTENEQRQLTLAALGAGLDIQWADCCGSMIALLDPYTHWNPYKDNGDAFQLAAVCKMKVDHRLGEVRWYLGDMEFCLTFETAHPIYCRRMIVEAAATIGVYIRDGGAHE